MRRANVRIEERLRNEVVEDQRRAGLGDRGIASLEDVERRRRQIVTVGVVVAAGLAVATSISAGLVDVGQRGWIDPQVARYASVALAICLVVYAFDKERFLRRFVRERDELLALDGEVAGHLLSAGLLLDAATAMHRSLELDDVLPAIVEQGRALTGSRRAVLFVDEGEQPMRPVLDTAAAADVAAGIVTLVEERRRVIALDDASATITIGVPVLDGNVQLGVLVLLDCPGGMPDEDLRALLERFGHLAGSALDNARRYEAAMFIIDSRD
jgi:hypothetical protein